MGRQVVGIITLKHCFNENFFIPHPCRGGNYRLGFGFLPDCGRRRHSYGDGWQQLLLLHAFNSDNSSGRHSTLDLEFDGTQQHVWYSGPSQRALGLWNS